MLGPGDHAEICNAIGRRIWRTKSFDRISDLSRAGSECKQQYSPDPQWRARNWAWSRERSAARRQLRDRSCLACRQAQKSLVRQDAGISLCLAQPHGTACNRSAQELGPPLHPRALEPGRMAQRDLRPWPILLRHALRLPRYLASQHREVVEGLQTFAASLLDVRR